MRASCWEERGNLRRRRGRLRNLRELWQRCRDLRSIVGVARRRLRAQTWEMIRAWRRHMDWLISRSSIKVLTGSSSPRRLSPRTIRIIVALDRYHSITTPVTSRTRRSLCSSSSHRRMSCRNFLTVAALSSQPTALLHICREPLSKFGYRMKISITSISWHSKWTPWLKSNQGISTMQWKQSEIAATTIDSSWVSLRTRRVDSRVREWWLPMKRSCRLIPVTVSASITMSCCTCINRGRRMHLSNRETYSIISHLNNNNRGRPQLVSITSEAALRMGSYSWRNHQAEARRLLNHRIIIAIRRWPHSIRMTLVYYSHRPQILALTLKLAMSISQQTITAVWTIQPLSKTLSWSVLRIHSD